MEKHAALLLFPETFCLRQAHQQLCQVGGLLPEPGPSFLQGRAEPQPTGFWPWGVAMERPVPAAQALRDCEKADSQGKRLLNLCRRVAAAQHTNPCFKSSLAGRMIRSHLPPLALRIS